MRRSSCVVVPPVDLVPDTEITKTFPDCGNISTAANRPAAATKRLVTSFLFQVALNEAGRMFAPKRTTTIAFFPAASDVTLWMRTCGTGKCSAEPSRICSKSCHVGAPVNQVSEARLPLSTPGSLADALIGQAYDWLFKERCGQGPLRMYRVYTGAHNLAPARAGRKAVNRLRQNPAADFHAVKSRRVCHAEANDP